MTFMNEKYHKHLSALGQLVINNFKSNSMEKDSSLVKKTLTDMTNERRQSQRKSHKYHKCKRKLLNKKTITITVTRTHSNTCKTCKNNGNQSGYTEMKTRIHRERDLTKETKI